MDGIQGDMMAEIENEKINEFKNDDLKDLFLSVGGLQVIFRISFRLQ